MSIWYSSVVIQQWPDKCFSYLLTTVDVVVTIEIELDLQAFYKHT